MTTLHFVTSNPHKVREVERILGVSVVPVPIALPEIQAATLDEIAMHKLASAVAIGRLPVAVEDVSLGLRVLGDFPGPYIKWLLEAAGGQGLSRIVRGLEDRRAVARCCVGWSDGTESRLFLGETAGTLLVEGRGDSHFGWDPWFVPGGYGRTYAEMSETEKDEVSHRSRAWRRVEAFLSER